MTTIVGHTKQREILRKLSEKETLPQSYLFVGPSGIGKKQVAFEFATMLLGVSHATEEHQDMRVLVPATEVQGDQTKKKQLAVEDVRQAILFLSRYPTLGKRRVVIIDDAEELSLGSQNALLKVLEEPNSTSILILITEQPGRLLPTLLSRMVLISFDLISKEELTTFFNQRSPLPSEFFFSLGFPGLLENAITNPEHFRSHQIQLGKLFQISTLSLRERLQLAEELARNQDTLPALFREWLAGLHHQFLKGETHRLQKRLLLIGRLLEGNRDVVLRRASTRLILEKLFLSL